MTCRDRAFTTVEAVDAPRIYMGGGAPGVICYSNHVRCSDMVTETMSECPVFGTCINLFPFYFITLICSILYIERQVGRQRPFMRKHVLFAFGRNFFDNWSSHAHKLRCDHFSTDREAHAQSIHISCMGAVLIVTIQI